MGLSNDKNYEDGQFLAFLHLGVFLIYFLLQNYILLFPQELTYLIIFLFCFGIIQSLNTAPVEAEVTCWM